MIQVGIDKLNAYIPSYYIDIKDLAVARNVDPDKYTIGIGQDEMAILSSKEDIITMAANAADSIITDEDKPLIDMVIFATESAFDYSKSAATYLTELLELSPYVRAVEMKQACYSGTAALQMAADYVRLRPERKVLVVTSDVARYGLDTPGEVTQGAGACAMLISSNPRILTLDEKVAFVTENQYDFWRPSYSDVALVDGAFSNQLYMRMFKQTLEKYGEDSLQEIAEIDMLHFHLPYSKMGLKAIQSIEAEYPMLEKTFSHWKHMYTPMTTLGRKVGNIYTGSLYLSFLSSLIYQKELKVGQKIGFFSYGSGAVSELFTGRLVENFEKVIPNAFIQDLFESRTRLTIADYERVFNGESLENTFPSRIQRITFSNTENHKRTYQK